MKKFNRFIHHLLIPKEKNNYRAKALHHDFLTAYLVLALIVTVVFKQLYNQDPTGNVLGYATDISTPKLLELTNQERIDAGLQPLTYNAKLEKAAQAKAQDMFQKNYWAHYGPNNENPWQFILGSGYDYEYAGENLAKNFLFSKGVVDAWMDSPTHKENIVRKEYTDVGFAVVNGMLNGEETTLVVQMFGTPLNSVTTAQNTAQQPLPVENPAVESEPQIVINKDPNTAPQAQQEIKGSTSFVPAYFNFNVLFFTFLVLALALDFYFATKFKIARINGKNIIHIMFLGAITIGLFIVANGQIV